MNARPHWEVLNRGVNGERSDQICARFDRDVLGAAPDAVVIVAGVNDVYQGRPLAHAIGHLREMYERAAASGILVVAGSILPFNTATRDQNAAMRALNAWIEQYIASSSTALFVDTRAAVAAPDDADRLASSPDALHPSPDGYRRMAEALVQAIDQLSGAGSPSASRDRSVATRNRSYPT
jgi:lysophospholipase L1-like esterase